MAVRMINGAEFLHIPKTGGSWVTSILEHNNLISNKIGHTHADFDINLFQDRSLSGRQHLFKAFNRLTNRFSSNNTSNNELNRNAPFRFCFVRNPLTWYESWWRYMEGRGWNDWGRTNSATYWHPNSILNDLGSSDFNEFLWNVIKKRPGYVSELFFSYTKPGISFIGKTENLRQDLLDVLNLLNIDVDSSDLLKSKKENESITPKSLVEWDPKLKQSIIKLELPALIHFGYLNEKEQTDLGISNFVPTNEFLQIKKHINM